MKRSSKRLRPKSVTAKGFRFILTMTPWMSEDLRSTAHQLRISQASLVRAALEVCLPVIQRIDQPPNPTQKIISERLSKGKSSK